MSIKTRRNLGGISIFISIILTIMMMQTVILPQYVMNGMDIVIILLLTVTFGIIGIYSIFTTIDNERIKCIVMQYVVKVLAAIYLLLLLYVMILSRLSDGGFGRSDSGLGYEYNFIPLYGIANMVSMVLNKRLNTGIMIENFIGNILMFLPMVIFIKLIIKDKYKEYICLLISFGICIILEMIQCITYCGAFDVDDILLNTIGMVIGYLLTKTSIYSKITKKLYLVRED